MNLAYDLVRLGLKPLVDRLTPKLSKNMHVRVT